MSDARPLPPRPNSEHYRKLAKDLQRACKSGNDEPIAEWAAAWRKFRQTNENSARCLLAGAQFFMAREHGFASWAKFAAHLEGLTRADSAVAQFESAADAIVCGDLAKLTELLRANPGLVQTRSTRDHHSTLLHYVSANGVEDFRQKTPENIVEIARLLLDSGAQVDAESEAYGGHSTPLELVATSAHPARAGIQIAVMELLIARGAMADRPGRLNLINNCLRNGRGQAADFLATRGAALDFEGAAGVGRVDLIRSISSPAPEEMRRAFAWACEFGRTDVVEHLLDRGMDITTPVPNHGQTGLHWAACQGHIETAKLLLRRGAPVNALDETFRITPLSWVLHGWRNDWATPHERLYAAAALLVSAGAKVEPGWAADPAIRADPRMLAALTGDHSEA